MIPPGLLKDAALVFTKPLTLIINLFLETGIGPGKWKVAKVIHLYKSVCTAEIYRPIADQSQFSLLCQRIWRK